MCWMFRKHDAPAQRCSFHGDGVEPKGLIPASLKLRWWCSALVCSKDIHASSKFGVSSGFLDPHVSNSDTRWERLMRSVGHNMSLCLAPTWFFLLDLSGTFSLLCAL